MKKKDCKHKKIIPLYGRDQNLKSQFFSIKKKFGIKLFICEDCGKIIKEVLEEVLD